MDMDLLLIAVMVITIVAIVGGSVNGIVSKVLDFKQSQGVQTTAQSGSSAQVNQIAERTQIIEDRLAVLERIATDRGQLLSDEIEALRGETKAIREEKVAQ